MAANRVGEAVDQGLTQGTRCGQQGLHTGCRKEAGEHVAVLGIAPVFENVLVILGTKGNLEAGAVSRAEEKRHAGHARQVELLVALDDGGRQQVVDTDPIAALVVLDKFREEGIKTRVLTCLDQPQPIFPLLAFFSQDLVADRLVQDWVGMVPFQAGKEDFDLGPGLVIGQIGDRDANAADGEIRAFGKQLFSIGKLDHHGRAEVHSLLTSTIVAGEGNGIDVELSKGAGGRLQLIVALVLVVLLPILQRLVHAEGVQIAIEIALGLEQAYGLGRHEVGDPFKFMNQALLSQLVTHVDDPPAGSTSALDLHLDQKTAVAVFTLSQVVEDVIEIFFSEQRNELFDQVLLLF